MTGEELEDKAKNNLYPDPDADFPLMVAVGGKEHRFCGGMNAKLGDKTSVYFMPPVMGG